MSRFTTSLVCFTIVSLGIGCESGSADATGGKKTPESVENFGHLPIPPIPRAVDVDSKKVALGRELFHDTRLSRDNTLSCSSCHNLDRGGDDDRPVSIGIDGQLGGINSPTVLNSGFNFRQFWDGRAATLEDQVDGPLHNSVEMGSSFAEVIGKLNKDSAFVARFTASYPDGLTPPNLRDAIAEFERSLITPDSAFDRFLRGDESAMSESAHRGWKLFQDLSCISCHQGVNMGGNVYQKIGVMNDYFGDREVTKADLGRFNVTNDPRDKHKFKVPTLRNVAITAPYFHDGSAATLGEAVRRMADYQLGYELEDREVADIVAFLESLTGEFSN
ncbi:MAG: cytochrome-c peroxidase [Planctomycetota bacterium]